MSIIRHGKVIGSVYHRIRDGILVIICSTRTAFTELDYISKAIIQKVIDQKKKHIDGIQVYQFNS